MKKIRIKGHFTFHSDGGTFYTGGGTGETIIECEEYEDVTPRYKVGSLFIVDGKALIIRKYDGPHWASVKYVVIIRCVDGQLMYGAALQVRDYENITEEELSLFADDGFHTKNQIC